MSVFKFRLPSFNAALIDSIAVLTSVSKYVFNDFVSASSLARKTCKCLSKSCLTFLSEFFARFPSWANCVLTASSAFLNSPNDF